MNRALLLSLVVAPFATAQVQLEFGSQSATYNRVLQLQNGARLLIGSTQVGNSTGLTPGQHLQIVLSALGTPPFHDQPSSISPRLGGNGNDIPQDAAIDPNGNVWIVGKTDSDDFNLINPIVAQKVPYRTSGFVMELDPTGNKLLFATYLGGQRSSALRYATSATAIAFDKDGNVYVGGQTNEPDFPTTPGAFLTSQGGADDFGNTFTYSFLVKISQSGQLVYSTLLHTGKSGCVGGSSCIGRRSTYANVSGMVVNSSGAAVVAGIAGGADSVPGGYVSAVSPDASNSSGRRT